MLERDAEQPGHAPYQPDGRVADAHDPLPQRRAHHLRDDAGGVGEVDGPGVGRHLRDRLRHLVHDGDGAQGVGQSAGADGLLAEQPEIEGDAFVPDPSLSPSHPDGREDEVGAGERVREVGGGRHTGRVDELLGPLGEQRGDGVEAGGGRVVENDLVDVHGRQTRGGERIRGDGLVDERHAETTATEDDELHGIRTSGRASGRRTGWWPARAGRDQPVNAVLRP